MHLKTLSLRGFKSFASATTLHLEPGVTCVVGPNGSGKSNVVDALAWVMGEQGAKSLRGGKMEDVIFAGTAGRAPLGRAEVSLTIDNADGALPIDYSEVTISRTLFRNGGSEYAINGSPCRLLDIQELLSDTGMGREMHVIVGQGQLDAVLRATPEERRGFIEEAAGVLKHRKRKEKALRKLDAMQANLTRVGDLTAEIRRQLGPLGRQAAVARKAQVIQADLRDAKARLLADDLAQLTATLQQEIADETALNSRRTEVEGSLADVRARLAGLESQAAQAVPQLSEASEVWYRLSSLRERLRGTASLASERSRLLGTAAGVEDDRDLGDLDAQAERVRAAQAELEAEVELARTALEAAVTDRQAAEDSVGEAERALGTLQRAAADRREGLAQLAGEVAARRSRLEATEAEIGRLREVLLEAEKRGQSATEQFSMLETQVTGAEQGEESLDAEHEAAAAALERAVERMRELREQEQVADRERSTWAARVDALEMSLTRKDGAGALLAAEGLRGTLGSVAALLGVTHGYEDAIAAALGPAADAVAVESVDAAVDALRWLRTDDAGRARLVIGTGVLVAADDHVSLPDGARWARSLVTAPKSVDAAVTALLAGVVVVENLAHARALVAERPELTVVTRSGDLLSATAASGGSADAPSVLQLQATLDEARSQHTDAVARGERIRFELATAQDAEARAREDYERTLDRLHESDAAMAAVAEQLGQFGSAARAARAEADRVQRSLDGAVEQLEAGQVELAALSERLTAAQAEPAEIAESLTTQTEDRGQLADLAAAARGRETEARLTLRTGEERARALANRADSLERAAQAEREARERAQVRERQRIRQATVAAAVHSGAQRALLALDGSLQRATEEREAAEAARTERDAALAALRGQADGLGRELAELTDVAHRDEVARAQQALRVEQLQDRAIEDLGIDPEVLLAEYGPHQLVPVLALEAADGGAATEPQFVPYLRADQEKRLRIAERGFSLLGRVNPLALEEFSALEERHQFLTEQLADLKKSRADLLEIIREIDTRVEQVFADAFRDTAEQFEGVFARLFPGGEGRLMLTEPDDMLATGIEVEARPAGKKVKRLSLLSGGERSLTAIALLIAIFKARPSPFYVLDEVEASLDDVNLGRLLEIFTELQHGSQLIIITHQKRTMEIADSLYGVTMRGDGVTTVVSQRMREDVSA